ncbi:MAG: hypothetical protein KF713_09365 [Turneriella sp.]|nr:hypothetical protein [Turneriella sp.]
MRKNNEETIGLWGTIALTLLLYPPLYAQTLVKTKCTRLASAIIGFNYHRSEGQEIDRGQIWRFVEQGKLLTFSATKHGLAGAKPLSDAVWKLEDEDGRCVLKIAGVNRQEQTFRITEITWAIYNIGGEDKHVPDFEDHAGMKTRYCGSGDACVRLWK